MLYHLAQGAEVFDRYLIDWDPALNSANWQWLSASAFFHFFYRVYSPATYGQKSDPTGALIRRFCPELDGFSDKHIYTPWLASKKEQEKAGCIIGKDYPEVNSIVCWVGRSVADFGLLRLQRIVDEKEAKEKALKLMKAAYDAKLHGTPLPPPFSVPASAELIAVPFCRRRPASAGWNRGRVRCVVLTR